MRNTAFFSIFFVGLLSIFSACKEEKSKEDLLIGKWNVVSAVKSNGEVLVYDNENSKGEVMLEFFGSPFNWIQTVTNKNTGVKVETKPLGRANYSWVNDELALTFFPVGASQSEGTAEVDFPNENTLNILFHISYRVGPGGFGTYTVDMKAERQ